ncbi:MAG: arylsulfatase [Hyphomonadaceae bacterium]|nr:arylsulfatase [Hyphomonadaceae bacterium]
MSMRRRAFLAQASAASLLAACAAPSRLPALAAGTRPNILVIMADDLGYSDLGTMGGEIPTPHLDALAGEGRVLTAMYASPLPISRGTLLTGADHHIIGYGSMGPPAGRQVGKPGYERRLNDRARTIATLLRGSGYRTYMAGVWGLGAAPEADPSARGFEQSFALIEAAADYFPIEAERLRLETMTYRQNGAQVAQPDRYVTDVYTDRMIGFIDANASDLAPFFAYLPYSAPHFPLQAHPDFIDRFKGAYDAGYDAIRLARIARQRASGVIAADFKPAQPVPESDGFKSWASLTPEERRIEARRMEVYAAMVANLDWNIGRLIAYLKRIGRYDNTFILFASGNGAASAWSTRRLPENVDNSLANMGRRHSWISYTERWAEVSNAPLSMWKTRMTEGGISVPTIVRLPRGAGVHEPIRAPATFADVAPTLLELAGLPRPQNDGAAPLEGVSLLPLLEGRATRAHSEDAVFADEMNGEAFVRRGRWKASLLATADPGDALRAEEIAALARGDLVRSSEVRARFPRVWHLFDIEGDRGETTDVSAAHPDILAALRADFSAYRERVGVVDP